MSSPTPLPSSEPGEVATAAPPSGYIGLIRHYRAMRDLWLGRAISLVGDWFNFIALFEAIQGLTTSARAITLVMVAKTLPIFVLTPLVGPIVDRFDRRTLLVAADLFRAVCALGLIVSYHFDSVIGLYACTVVMVCGTAVSVPASNAALPMIVPAARVPTANALLGGSWSISLAAGAALGGVTTELFGVTTSLLMDAATFVLSSTLMMRLPRLLPPSSKGRALAPASPSLPAGQAGFRDGLRYLSRQPYILCLASVKPLMQVYGGLSSLVPLYGSIVFAGAKGPFYVGVLYAMRGLGAMVGSLMIRALFGDAVATMRRLIAVGFVLGAAGYASLAWSTHFWHACVGFFVSSVGQAIVWVFSGSLLQIEAEPRYHGRIFSLEFGLITLLIAAASYLAGAALDWGMTLERVVLTFASLGLIPLSLWLTVLWRKRRR